MNIETKRQKEKDTVALMIEIYCKKHHKSKHLCQECQQLKDYAFTRSDKCPFMETKSFCSNCKVHCYRPDMQQKIREVMAYSGPRMLFYHPVMAIKHVIETQKEKRRLENAK